MFFPVHTLKVLKKEFFYVIGAAFMTQQVIAGTGYSPGLPPLSLKVSGNYYFSEDLNYLQPTVSVFLDNVFVAFRYNYEDLHTYSLYGGYSIEFSTAENNQFLINPLAGFASGNTRGILAGLETDLTVHRFNIYSENEYLWAYPRRNQSFFFSWIDLTYSLEKRRKFWAGISTQVEIPKKEKMSFAEGITAYYSFGKVTIQAYYLNPFMPDQLGIFGIYLEL